MPYLFVTCTHRNKRCPCAHHSVWRSGVIASLILNFGLMEVSEQLHALAALNLGDRHGTHSVGSGVGPIVGPKAKGRQKYIFLAGKNTIRRSSSL